MESLETTRIGSKMVSRKKIDRVIDKLITLRSQGLSQQEVANRLGLERSFVSRIESVGEIRKGKKLAMVAFPVQNKDDINELCQNLGIDYVLLMNNEERWGLIHERSALDFFNIVVNIITELKQFDLIVLMTSENWKRVAEAFLDNEIVFWELGDSPLEHDCMIDTNKLEVELKPLTE